LTNNPSTTHKYVSAPQNTEVSLDFGICVNHICRKGNTCFALYVDLGLKLLYVKCLPSRGVVVVSLLGYCQRWGDPAMLTFDNAKEFLQGDMALELSKRSIQANPSPPYSPNKSPTERWIGIVSEGARSMLYL
jgi:hypothetical protein